MQMAKVVYKIARGRQLFLSFLTLEALVFFLLPSSKYEFLLNYPLSRPSYNTGNDWLVKILLAGRAICQRMMNCYTSSHVNP